MSIKEINEAKKTEYIYLRDYHVSMGDRYMADYYDELIKEFGEETES